MEIKNWEKLENQLQYSGFGAVIDEKMKEMLSKGDKEVHRKHSLNYGNDEVEATLNFKMSDKIPGNYFFNSFDLSLKKDDTGATVSQKFNNTFGHSFTLKEGYNLVAGRSVHKDFIKVDRDDSANNKHYNAWASLNFKETDDYGNFKIKKSFNLDIEKLLNSYPIRELKYDQSKSEMLQSLKKGNRHHVTFEENGNSDKRLIEVDARFRKLNVYDTTGKIIRMSVKKKEAESQGQSKEQSSQQHVADDIGAGSKKTGKGKQADSTSEDAADSPKKRRGRAPKIS